MKTTPTREAKPNDWRDRALKAEARCEQLEAALRSVREIITQSEIQCHDPPDDGGDSCDGGDCIFCASVQAIDAALAASKPGGGLSE